VEAAKTYYGEDMAAFSIPAMEHSTVTSWGRENQFESYQNMIKEFGDSPLYAIVGDSYDIFDACENIFGTMLKNKILAAKGVLVVRPDSGIPHVIVAQIVNILGNKFGYTTNEKGYKVLNKVRVIQGDGINQEEIEKILFTLKEQGWSADNVAFGMGGALLNGCNRDTQRFAIKASSMVKNGKVYDVYKDPITDSGKKSKRGRLKLIVNELGHYQTVEAHEYGKNVLVKVWEDGKLLVDPLFRDIRAMAQIPTLNVVKETV
jgi:nicotinamide phosphoribosyltransferase